MVGTYDEECRRRCLDFIAPLFSLFDITIPFADFNLGHFGAVGVLVGEKLINNLRLDCET